MIALVTDSNAMLPGWLRDRFGIRVVALGLTLDGRPLQEDEELDRAAVLESMRRGASLATSAPSPGTMADEFDQAV
ncbi:MAG: DegV family protein, partial [Mycobacterium sp.]